MAVTANRAIAITLRGTLEANLSFEAAEETDSPGVSDLIDLASGNNTITPPSGAGSVTILPPAGNTDLITLKGVNGDTGIPLHLTDPTSLGLDSTLTTFVLNAADAITGVRLIWT